MVRTIVYTRALTLHALTHYMSARDI